MLTSRSPQNVENLPPLQHGRKNPFSGDPSLLLTVSSPMNTTWRIFCMAWHGLACRGVPWHCCCASLQDPSSKEGQEGGEVASSEDSVEEQLAKVRSLKNKSSHCFGGSCTFRCGRDRSIGRSRKRGWVDGGMLSPRRRCVGTGTRLSMDGSSEISGLVFKDRICKCAFCKCTFCTYMYL